jgi:hypothetical protein
MCTHGLGVCRMGAVGGAYSSRSPEDGIQREDGRKGRECPTSPFLSNSTRSSISIYNGTLVTEALKTASPVLSTPRTISPSLLSLVSLRTTHTSDMAPSVTGHHTAEFSALEEDLCPDANAQRNASRRVLTLIRAYTNEFVVVLARRGRYAQAQDAVRKRR